MALVLWLEIVLLLIELQRSHQHHSPVHLALAVLVSSPCCHPLLDLLSSSVRVPAVKVTEKVTSFK
jgi:hypothetical protein